MRITALLENTSCRADVKTEHGLSLYIETSHRKILFDMGQTALFEENARTLKTELSKVDLAVVSHGHYDHGGGLARFLEINKTAPVYIRRDAFLPHYNGTDKYIGLDPDLSSDPRLIFTEDICEIDTGLTLFSCNDRIRRRSFGSFGLTEKRDGRLVPDEFYHEQYLLITEGDKRVLISGCSHKGILDIAEWFSPHVLIGGFHFSKMPLDSTLKEAALRLASFPTSFYTCHCTGTEQFAFMKQYIPKLSYLSCGQSIEI